MSIKLTSSQPVFQRPYRLAQTEKDWLKLHLAELQAKGLIQRSHSPYSSPVHIVPKKGGDGKRSQRPRPESRRLICRRCNERSLASPPWHRPRFTQWSNKGACEDFLKRAGRLRPRPTSGKFVCFELCKIYGHVGKHFG